MHYGAKLLFQVQSLWKGNQLQTVIMSKSAKLFSYAICYKRKYECDRMAEGVGFEPTVENPPLRFSRPVH